MAKTKFKSGFCKSCIANVEHRRSLRSPFFPGFDLITLRLFKLIGVGPWYCIGCGQKRLLLGGEKKDAALFDPRRDDDEPAEVERVGNVLRTDYSLVDQTTRKSRFTVKFRDGIAQRVASGESTAARTSRDLGVKEIDIEIWIKDLHQRELDRRLDGQATTIEGQVQNRIHGPSVDSDPIPNFSNKAANTNSVDSN